MKEWGRVILQEYGYSSPADLRLLGSFSILKTYLAEWNRSVIEQVQEDGWAVESVTPVMMQQLLYTFIFVSRDKPAEPYRPQPWDMAKL